MANGGGSLPSAGKGALVTVTRLPCGGGGGGRGGVHKASSAVAVTFGQCHPQLRPPHCGMPPVRPEHLGPGVLSTTDRETEAAGGLRTLGLVCGLERSRLFELSGLGFRPRDNHSSSYGLDGAWPRLARSWPGAGKCYKHTPTVVQTEVPRPRLRRKEKPASRHKLPAGPYTGPPL